MRVGANTSPASAGRQKQGLLARWLAPMHAEWRAFTQSPPGKRFEERYRRKRNADRPAWRKIMLPALGLLIIALGLILLPAPGPGILVVLAGFALVAEHFLWAARMLDRCELPLRSFLQLVARWWKNTALTMRWVVCIVSVLVVLALGAALITLIT